MHQRKPATSTMAVAGGKSVSESGQRKRESKVKSADDTILFVCLGVLLLLFCSVIGCAVYLSNSSVADTSAAHNYGRKVKSSQYEIAVDLRDLYTGSTYEVYIDRQAVCTHCQGLGADLDAGYTTCPYCSGQGYQVYEENYFGIHQRVRSECEYCSGKGKIMRKKCSHCHGHGSFMERPSVKVDIQPGMINGDQIVLPGKGHQMRGANPGDLIFNVVQSEKESNFIRKGKHLETSIKISLLESLVGFSREFKHLDDHLVSIKRTEVTPHGSNIRVRKEGMPIYDSSSTTDDIQFGDLLIHIMVDFPKELSAKQVSYVKKLLPE